MIKKIAPSLFAFSALFYQAQAQNPNLDYKYAVKIYNLSSYEKATNPVYVNDPHHYVDFSTTNFQLLHPTVAFQWNAGISRSHEIELTSFSSGSTTKSISIRNDGTGNEERLSQGELSTTYVSLRYEYIWNFNKKKDSKFIPSFGGSLSPYFQKNEYSTDPAFGLPSSQLKAGIRVNIIPRLTYHINSKFFVDLNLPICIHDVSYLNVKEENHLLPERQKDTSQFQLNQFPGLYSARLGFGFKI